MSTILVSLIICSHNPRIDYFTRVLDAIQKQTLPASSYELVIIDNLSEPSLSDADYIDLAWHPNQKIVVEEALGLTSARLRGFRETSSEIIVFCDDDNILAPNYLERAIRIGNKYPLLGAWGGDSEGEFESPLPEWADGGFFSSIGIRKFGEIHWSNLLNHCCPIGAGMVLRRSVADAYIKKLESNPMCGLLGRSGSTLMSAEDIDLANTASEIGMGTGLFPELTLKHLIPSQRLTLDYYERLVEGIAASLVILKYMQGTEIKNKFGERNKIRYALKELYFRLNHTREECIVHKAQKRGELKGMEVIQQMLLSEQKKTDVK